MTHTKTPEVGPSPAPIETSGEGDQGHSFLFGLGARLVVGIVRFLGASFRWRMVDKSGSIAAINEHGEPHILLAWHNRLLIAAPYFVKTLVRKGTPVSVLISLSDDGELATRVVHGLGAGVVRGSSSRGGASALRNLLQAVRRDGSSVVIIPDGPRGPLYEMKIGPLALSQMTGIPILPVGMAVGHCWRIRSWDRLIIPWPGTRTAILVGNPKVISRQLTPEDLETERLRIQDELIALTERAEEMLGVEDIARKDSIRPL